MEKRYNIVRTPKVLDTYDRLEISDYLDFMIVNCKREASPGVPYAAFWKSNGEMIDSLGSQLNKIVLDRIEAINNWNGNFSERRELVENGLCDPIRVFIKNELHSAEKVKQKRFRLIMSVSIIDKLVEMVFYHHVCKQQIRDWEEIPSKPGMGFTEEMSKSIYDNCMEQDVLLAEADISGWDWSVQQWTQDFITEFIQKLQPGSTDWYGSMLTKLTKLQSNPVYQFSDGTLAILEFSGNQSSGKFMTSCGNSIGRVLVATLVGAGFCIAMGDDAVEEFVEDAQLKYNTLGYNCKMYGRVEKEFEFCSHKFTKNGSYSVGTIKLLGNLLHKEDAPIYEKRAYTMQFEDDIEGSPEKEQLLGYLDRVGWYTKNNA